MIIGITGTIGSGKSTVARIFEKHGFYLIDADIIGHLLLKKFSPQYRNLVESFGSQILSPQGEIDRKILGDIAFSEKKNYRKLNSIMIPPIIKEIKNRIKNNPGKDIALDAPLLLETAAKELVDKIVVVKASENNILYRNKKFSKSKLIRIKKYQMSISEKLKHADHVINNDGNVKTVENQVRNIIASNKKV